MTRLRVALTLLLAVAVPRATVAAERLRLSTTTSTENSGLLKVLLPPFEAAHDVKVE
jgi:tungstate transport system substrate-binding protein